MASQDIYGSSEIDDLIAHGGNQLLTKHEAFTLFLTPLLLHGHYTSFKVVGELNYFTDPCSFLSSQ